MTDYTPADLRSWSLSALLAEYGAQAIAYALAVRTADPDGPDVDLSEYEHGLTLVADEIERRTRNDQLAQGDT